MCPILKIPNKCKITLPYCGGGGGKECGRLMPRVTHCTYCISKLCTPPLHPTIGLSANLFAFTNVAFWQ